MNIKKTKKNTDVKLHSKKKYYKSKNKSKHESKQTKHGKKRGRTAIMGRDRAPIALCTSALRACGAAPSRAYVPAKIHSLKCDSRPS